MRSPIIMKVFNFTKVYFKYIYFSFPTVRFNSLKENYNRHYIDTNKPITLSPRSTPPPFLHRLSPMATPLTQNVCRIHLYHPATVTMNIPFAPLAAVDILIALITIHHLQLRVTVTGPGAYLGTF